VKAIEPVGVSPDGSVTVKATYEQGDTLSELGLTPEQSASLWAACEAKWQQEYGWSARQWRIGRVTIHLDWLFEREIDCGSATNEDATSRWIELWFYRIGITIWKR
jgi:hypothetical protein